MPEWRLSIMQERSRVQNANGKVKNRLFMRASKERSTGLKNMLSQKFLRTIGVFLVRMVTITMETSCNWHDKINSRPWRRLCWGSHITSLAYHIERVCLLAIVRPEFEAQCSISH